jgi:hypothetical protein
VEAWLVHLYALPARCSNAALEELAQQRLWLLDGLAPQIIMVELEEIDGAMNRAQAVPDGTPQADLS